MDELNQVFSPNIKKSYDFIFSMNVSSVEKENYGCSTSLMYYISGFW